MGNWPVNLRSAANLQNASTRAITPAGDIRAATASATCRFLCCFLRSFGPVPNLILITIRYNLTLPTSQCFIDAKDRFPYEKNFDSPDRNRLHGQGSRGEYSALGECRDFGGGRI